MNRSLPLRLAQIVLFTLSASSLIAAEVKTPAYKVLRCGKEVRILGYSDLREGSAPASVLFHGLGGRLDGDRFCELAAAVREACPESDVLIVDWTKSSCVGLPLPFRAAGNINPVAQEAAALLMDLGIDPKQMTIVGESFGNYVGAQVAAALGGGARMLAFNPASELGGYTPPDLTKVAAQSISFHTYSPYDTCKQIAHADLFLETPVGAGHSAQHTFGVVWLAKQVRDGQLQWLRCERSLPARKPGAFCGKATLAGEVLDAVILRQPEALAAE